jgi:urea carboxylase
VAGRVSRIEVLSAGTLTTIQDWPGRVGLWEVGVPPSGPMDDRSLRIGNRLLGNAEGAAGLEVTLTGPRLRFDEPTRIAVTGAPLPVTLDGTATPQWQPFDVPAGGVLALGAIRGHGLRAYVLVAGGIDSPSVMGARSVFAAARLAGGPLRKGDVLRSADQSDLGVALNGQAGLVPELTNNHTLRVVLGPHGAPDFLTPEGLAELLKASWTVHHHSDRTGIRLVGPRPRWARGDGGEAGLHPSNILDSAYSVGTVMLAGDMAVIVGVDGPSLGGFTAIAQVIRADLWRIGQLRAGDVARLEAVEASEAGRLHALPLGAAADSPAPRSAQAAPAPPIAFDRPQDGSHGPLTFRRAGECALLVEFGEARLDLRSRVRAHMLRAALDAEQLAGIGDVTPGVRSLHIGHDPDRLSAETLRAALERLEAELPAPEQATVEGRTVRLPLAWRHSEAMRAVRRYQESVRADAPWCPDNIEFIRRINGLPDEDAVQRIVLEASYLVLGLGDVYLGAPVAVPLDPRHRLVTTKYNPARTWTPPNAVGIGGAFLCVYGIEGPGGYQLVGRTAQIWHAREDPPWRLRHFDQLRFELISEPELEELRAASDAGLWRPETEPVSFSLDEHERFLVAHADEIESFTARRQDAFEQERRAWLAADETAGVAA